MRAMYERVARIAMSLALRYLTTVTPERYEEAARIISYEMSNMALDSVEAGHPTSIPTGVRAEYEGRILEALVAAGIIREDQ